MYSGSLKVATVHNSVNILNYKACIRNCTQVHIIIISTLHLKERKACVTVVLLYVDWVIVTDAVEAR